MGYKRKTFVIILFFIFLSFCHTVYADTTNDATKVMIILDASGSMWGKVDGKPKIQIAREVLKDLLPKFGTHMHLGLSAYGHRKKGDCNDIETLIPIGPLISQQPYFPLQYVYRQAHRPFPCR